MYDKPRIDYPHPEELYRFLERCFDEAAQKALEASRTYHEVKTAYLLGMLEGASFKSLAHVAHIYGLSGRQRSEWYDVAKSVPLSQAHVSYIILQVEERDRLLEKAETLLGQHG